MNPTSAQSPVGHRNYFPILAATYLMLPGIVFLLTWVRLEIGLPVAGCLVAALVLFARQSREWRPQNPISQKNLFCVCGAAFVFALIVGLGGFFPQGGDYIKHNLLYHDLVNQHWPVVYESEPEGSQYLCYGLGYYLVPALAGRWLGEGWLPLLTFIWGFWGVALAFYWFSTLGKRTLLTLAFFVCFALTGILVYPLKQIGIPGIIAPEKMRELLFETGLYHCYHDNFIKFYLQPQHGLPAWIGAALLFEFVWLRKDPRAGMFLWTLGVFWSPMTCLGLLLIPLAAVTKTGVLRYFTPTNILAGCWLMVIVIYLQGHIPLSQKGMIFQNTSLGMSLLLYLAFLALELNIVFILILLDRQYAMLKGFRPLFYVSAAALILMPLFKVGACSDLRLQAGAPLVLCVAMATLMCFRHEKFRLQTPLGLLLALSFSIGAIYPISRPAIMRWVDHGKNFSYAALVKERGFHTLPDYRVDSGVDVASQYYGRSNSIAARFLLR